MKIAWLPALIFCATLVLVAASLDLGPIIKTAQCQSTCLRHHMIDGNCWNINKTNNQISDCYKVIKNILYHVAFLWSQNFKKFLVCLASTRYETIDFGKILKKVMLLVSNQQHGIIIASKIEIKIKMYYNETKYYTSCNSATYW